ncbi:membrane protein insertase YidC [Salisediminibacterium selenitireducens]|uniref:Membrane protein insertase YidC n=1 Tax=Bacillus selenitireducens (strain ATCC 700615 / DSM 15326 / MLS10) TaxID=439292 RepID=D6Y1F1_BACIE|nr:membrane protein insertase YidC [Salisediminibacterium selenitireducens]ADI00738.1 membrane protein insertase, YidC/Oxa1 family [[Bacillus] selenitireducens MLS10]
MTIWHHRFTRPARKHGLLLIVAALILVILSGCQQVAAMEPINAETTGFFNHYVIYPFSYLLTFFADLFGGSYGASIIMMTVLIRTGLMPLMLKQQRTQLGTKKKMIEIQPELEALKAKYKDKKEPEAQQEMQQEMMGIYTKHQFNPLTSMGCLPMLIQLPILIGFYQAIMRTEEIASQQFLWFSLGETDLILPILAALVYFIQFRISLFGMEETQKKQMAVFGYLTPVMMGGFSFMVSAALPLYWTIGGLFLIAQTLVFKWMFREKNRELRERALMKKEAAPSEST